MWPPWYFCFPPLLLSSRFYMDCIALGSAEGCTDFDPAPWFPAVFADIT